MEFAQILPTVLPHSRFLARLLEAQPEMMDFLARHYRAPFTAAAMANFLTAPPSALDSDEALHSRLRQLRQRVMACLVVRDIGGLAALDEVMQTMTALAEVSLHVALSYWHRQMSAQFGEVPDQNGEAQKLMVIGMGKLGGGELNVSSDIDLIFVYPEAGESTGGSSGRRLDAFDYFSRLGKRLIAALNDSTSEGQVFRVDMRLRPNGDSGPLVCSLVSLENYFIAQGREWERYAWIKARLLNQEEHYHAAWANALAKTVRPFVFRKYLDFGAINAMNDLHAQIRREVARKGMNEHIKLGPGGIREIEFVAQVFQLIRGGRDSELQERPTLTVLQKIAERRLLPEETVLLLTEAYLFLRRLEHRLQYLDDAQTHLLPHDHSACAQLAKAMGFCTWDALYAVINTHRTHVAHAFEQLFAGADNGDSPQEALWREEIDAEEALESLSRQGFKNPQHMLESLAHFRQSAKYLQLPTTNRERLDAVGPRLIEAVASTANPDVTWQRSLRLVETVSRRGAYLALLQQHPQALKKVAEIIGSSAWAAEYLICHPILLDEVIDPRLYEIATDVAGFRKELDTRLADCQGDTEREMDILREAHHAQVFRLLAQDIAGLQTVERLADYLTELADNVLNQVLTLCWDKLKTRHPKPTAAPSFAIIAYGKLGGKELTYGSDLDLVFIHNDTESGMGELYARLVQRINTWLTSQTSAGQLFATDFRLRPNGDAGLLVCSFEAFCDYQRKDAWLWEHQALTRARFCTGDAALGQRFEALRQEILCRSRELTALKQSVLEMRERMLEQHASRSETWFDVKQDRGGLVDVEFIVQTLILGHANRYPELCQNLGNFALLDMAAKLALIPVDLVAPVREAYRAYRRLQHDARLNGVVRIRVEREAWQKQIAAVQALWQSVFGEKAPLIKG